MLEYTYKGKRFRQPFRFVISCVYTIVYTFKHRRLRSQIRIGLQLTAAFCMLGMAIPIASFMIVPNTVQADDDETIREVIKLKGASANNTSALKEEVLIQKALSNNVQLDNVNQDESVVAITYPAPISHPTIQNVSFKAKLVTEKKNNNDQTIDDQTQQSEDVSLASASADMKNEDTNDNSLNAIVQESAETASINTQVDENGNKHEPVKSDKQTDVASNDVVEPTANIPSSEPTMASTIAESNAGTTLRNEDDDNDELNELDVDAENVKIIESDDDVINNTPSENTTQGTAPQLIVKGDEVTIYKGTEFDPSFLISYTLTSQGTLPALQIDSNVDSSKNGTYYCTIKAIDQNGLSTTKTVKVIVETHPEQIQIEKKEAELKAEKEKADKHAANIASVRNAGGLLSEEKADRKSGPSYNPYPGFNYNNCTWAAWQLAHDNLGINLPKWGNASKWLAGAQASGYATGKIPMKGAIMVSGGGLKGMGHVSYVADVSEDGKSVYIKQGSYTNSSGIPWSGGYSETWQNAYGTLKSGLPILGYIYLN